MKINREELLTCLQKVAPALGTNLLVPEFLRFRFCDGRVMATDGSISMVTNLSDGSDLDCSIPGATLLSVLKGLSQEEVEITVVELKDGGSAAQIETNKVEASFPLSNAKVWLTIPDYAKEQFAKFPKEFPDALRFCRFSVSQDETSGPLRGVHIDGAYVYGTDGMRIARHKLGQKAKQSITIPPKCVDILTNKKYDFVDQHYIGEWDKLVCRDVKNEIYLAAILLLGDSVAFSRYVT